MRKVISFTLVLMLLGMLFTVQAFGAAGSASLSGSDTVRAGDTYTVTLSISGDSISYFQGTLSYDSDKLELSGINSKIGAPWTINTNGNLIIMTDSALSNPISSSTSVLSVTFKVKNGLKEGDKLTVGVKNIELDNATSSMTPGDASKTVTVAAPPSNNCDLSAIKVTNATLSPAFNKNTTYYTCTVPYEVEKLNLDYNRADSGQTVSISGNGNFVVGENTVTLTVKASNGATKTYTIVVTRQQDPNYKASTDATLSALTMEGVTLSPAFSPNVTEYIGYVSHETGLVKLTGIAHDEKALKVTESEMSLISDGATDVSIVCTAEDGKTTQTYTVHVYRMPAYTGGIPRIEYTNEKDIVPPEEPIPVFSIPKTLTLPLIGEASTALVAGIAAAVIVILLFVLGLLIGRVRRSNRWEEEEIYNDETSPLPTIIPEKYPPVTPTAAEEPQPAPPAPFKPEQSDSLKPTEQKKEKVPLDTMSLDQLLKDIHDM